MRAAPLNLTDLADAVVEATPAMNEEEQRLGIALYRLLAAGSPVDVSRAASAANLPEPPVTATLDRWPGVFSDGDGRVVGFWGLALDELTPTHRVELGGRILYAWCAWDTLFLPGLLGSTARVTSSDPTTADSISLTVSPTGIEQMSHPQGVVSFMAPDGAFDDGVVENFCHLVHFFTNGTTGDRWILERPGTFLLPLTDAFELGTLVNHRKYPAILGEL